MRIANGVILGLSIFLTARHLAAAPPAIRFDLPPTVVARPVAAEPSPEGREDASRLVMIELRLSSMIATPVVPRIDQWLIRCQPRGRSLTIADYAPRTEVASEIEGPIEINQSTESSHALGMSLDGAYGHLARIHSGFDQGKKQTDRYQVRRVAPVQAVTASGTINRGRGVYYKLRWTASQVLEGEKTFRVTFRVPEDWRGSLIDVSVIAQAEGKSLGGWDSEVKTLGEEEFLVAAYLEGDLQAEQCARKLFEAERELRRLVSRHEAHESTRSMSTWLRHVAVKLDSLTEPAKEDWIDRLVQRRADPHLDKEIQRLPMDIRVAVLEYVDVRDKFADLSRSM